MIYTTADFDGQQAADCTLLIGVGTTSHRLAVVDQGRQLKFAATYEPASAGPEVMALLNLDFGAVKLAVSDSRYSFIPADVYDLQHHDTYLRYLPFDGVGMPYVADMAPLGVKLLHQTSLMGLEPFANRFPAAVNYPLVQALLSAIAGSGVQTNGPVLVVERHSPWVTISVFNKGEFLYCHDFEADHVDDFTYHLLAVVKRFGLDEQQPTVQLAGDIDYGDAHYERAATYGGAVTLADSSSLTRIQVPDDVLPYQHRFLTLFGLLQCAS